MKNLQSKIDLFESRNLNSVTQIGTEGVLFIQLLFKIDVKLLLTSSIFTSSNFELS